MLYAIYNLLTLVNAVAPSAAEESVWKKHAINETSPYEAASAFDADNDGVLDVVCGAKWYKGPDFKQSFPTREVVRTGTYNNSFSVLPFDVNADGNMDYIDCSYFEKNVGWVENPGKAGAAWIYHEIDLPGSSECAWAIDLTGDGAPEIFPNCVTDVVFYELKNPGSKASWKKYGFGGEAAGHGVGSGDINGDGRMDVITPKGWFEAPENPAEGKWEYHADFTGDRHLGAAGIQILGRDLDGDGDGDIIWGMGHGLGLFWAKQEAPGKWSEKIPITENFHQAHTLLWADLDGDGRDDELVTGTRVYGHEVEPGDVDAPEIAYFTFDKSSGKWDKSRIYLGDAAKNAPPVERRQERDAQKDFPRGTAGTGLQLTAIDLDGDGDNDLLCPGKTGLYWFENPGTRK
jgi:FG-GAP-like repeat